MWINLAATQAEQRKSLLHLNIPVRMNDQRATIISLRERKNRKAIGIWLMIGVVMLVIQIALGGITRLTGSGLSITEWNVVTGTLPPMNEQVWVEEYAKYQSTPQFKLLNMDFTLADFKFIFFWEWLHRFWARLIGVVFLIGFIYFLATKKFDKSIVKPLIILFILGALQGAVGWIMVASGLVGDAVYVKPTRLALHFILALVLLCYTFWFALKMMVPAVERTRNLITRNMAWSIIIVLIVQLLYGALLAGHKAASAAATWPDINGALLHPAGLYKEEWGWLNLIENKISIHYIHRAVAYLLLLMTVVFSIRLRRSTLSSLLQRTIWLPVSLIIFQVLLGITAVLTSSYIIPGRWAAFEWAAQLHQITAICFLLSIVWMIYLTSGGKKAATTVG
jgi:cytochrome c oxidase assembly protein subunit 15